MVSSIQFVRAISVVVTAVVNLPFFFEKPMSTLALAIPIVKLLSTVMHCVIHY